MTERSWLVILGYPRSGTTYLFELLRRGDHLHGTSKAYASHISAIYAAEPRDDLRQAIRWSFRSMLDFSLEEAEASRADTVADYLKRHIGVGELAEGVLRHRDLPAGVYKEPFLSFAPELPYEALPNSRLIHIHRDGRDAADSLVRKYNTLDDASLRNPHLNELLLTRRHGDLHVPWWVEDGRDDEFLAATPFIRALWLWRYMTRRVHDFATQPDVAASGRVTEVRYESLVRDPMGQGRQLLESLGLPLNSRMRRALGEGHDRSVDIHKRLDDSELRAAERLAGDELGALGYH